MQHYCSNCNIYTKQQYCPLCKYKLSEKLEDNTYYPVYETKVQRRRFAQRLVLFIAFFVISTSLLINLLTDPHPLWFLYVLGPVLYTLLLINHTILSKAHTGSKVIFQVIALSIMLFILDAASGSSRWSIHYVIPFLVTLATLFVTIIVLRKPMKWREYIGYMTTMVILGFVYDNNGYFRISSCHSFSKLLVNSIMAERSNCLICSAYADWNDPIFRKNDEERNCSEVSFLIIKIQR